MQQLNVNYDEVVKNEAYEKAEVSINNESEALFIELSLFEIIMLPILYLEAGTKLLLNILKENKVFHKLSHR